MSLRALSAPLFALSLALGCQRTPEATPTPSAPTPPPSAPANTPPAPPAPNPPGQGTPPSDDPSPSGPRAEVRGERYQLTAELSPTGANADLVIEIRGTQGYHVNEQYPVAIDLDVRNGTAPKLNLRRADAATYTQQLARFAQPLTGTGRGTVVRGRCRFAVCSEANCWPETRNFAIALN